MVAFRSAISGRWAKSLCRHPIIPILSWRRIDRPCFDASVVFLVRHSATNDGAIAEPISLVCVVATRQSSCDRVPVRCRSRFGQTETLACVDASCDFSRTRFVESVSMWEVYFDHMHQDASAPDGNAVNLNDDAAIVVVWRGTMFGCPTNHFAIPRNCF